jgi:hypothetical protein
MRNGVFISPGVFEAVHSHLSEPKLANKIVKRVHMFVHIVWDTLMVLPTTLRGCLVFRD